LSVGPPAIGLLLDPFTRELRPMRLVLYGATFAAPA